MSRENPLWGAPRIHGTSDARFQSLGSHRVAVHAPAKQTAGTIVADVPSQSSHGVSVTASMPRSGRVKTLDYGVILYGPVSAIRGCEAPPGRPVAHSATVSSLRTFSPALDVTASWRTSIG